MGLPLYVAPKVATTNDGPVFTLFNYLPWELRHMIWERALPPTVPQVMIYKPATFPKWDPETNTWDAIDGPPTVPIPPPTLLHVTKESRTFALKHVLIREVQKASTQLPAPNAYHRMVSRRFNRDTDALFIHERYFDNFVEMYKSTRPQAARHLIFNRFNFGRRQIRWLRNVPHPWRDFVSVADGSCRGLRSVNMACEEVLDDYLQVRPEPLGELEEMSYYCAVPGLRIAYWESELYKPLVADFESLHVPGGVPWTIRVGSRVQYDAYGEEDSEGFLDCSEVTIQRFTGSNMYSDQFH